MDSTQKFFIWGIIIIFAIFVIYRFAKGKCLCSNQEGFSPYRRTGGCPVRTGWNYLDAYEDQEYYRKYPYIYPTPTNYIRDLYKGRRAQNKFQEKQHEKVIQEYLEG